MSNKDESQNIKPAIPDAIVDADELIIDIYPEYDQETMDELVESIRQHGMLFPVLICEWQGAYHIVAGARRFIAAKQAPPP